MEELNNPKKFKHDGRTKGFIYNTLTDCGESVNGTLSVIEEKMNAVRAKITSEENEV